MQDPIRLEARHRCDEAVLDAEQVRAVADRDAGAVGARPIERERLVSDRARDDEDLVAVGDEEALESLREAREAREVRDRAGEVARLVASRGRDDVDDSHGVGCASEGQEARFEQKLAGDVRWTSLKFPVPNSDAIWYWIASSCVPTMRRSYSGGDWKRNVIGSPAS